MCSVAGEVRGGGRTQVSPQVQPPHRCLFWCCCCNCSCLAAKSGSEPTKKPRDPSPSDPLLCDNEPPPTMEEIQAWGKSFDKLMRSSAGRKVFRDFLRGEYSEENIMFWLACEELKKENDPDAVEEKARFIYEDYISILSPKEVSLDSHVREIVNRNMVQPTPRTFDEAQLQIYTLMSRDSYPRFVNSSLYKTLAQITATSPAHDKALSAQRYKQRSDSKSDAESRRASEAKSEKSEKNYEKLKASEIKIIEISDTGERKSLLNDEKQTEDKENKYKDVQSNVKERIISDFPEKPTVIMHDKEMDYDEDIFCKKESSNVCKSICDSGNLIKLDADVTSTQKEATPIAIQVCEDTKSIHKSNEEKMEIVEPTTKQNDESKLGDVSPKA